MTPRHLYAAACIVAGIVGGVAAGLGTPHPLAVTFGAVVAAALALGASTVAALLEMKGREQ